MIRPPESAAIETFGLTKTYGATRAVVDLDLRVDAGQVFGFLGPNGAGKTTTIRLLLALQRPTSGRAAVLGLDPRRDGLTIHRRVGYLPGDLELYRRMTGREHIEWFARARGVEDLSVANELVERFDVTCDRPVRELSKGNRQKVALVLAFLHRPELLVLDEPTGGLDPLMQNEFQRLLREVVADGRTVFLSSHDLDEVQRVADRVAIIRSGTLVMTDSVDGLRRKTPLKVQAWFRGLVDRSSFDLVEGVAVTACEGPQISLEVATGAVGAALRLIAEHDPVDVLARHADLDELFLGLYREVTPGEPARAG